MTEKKTLPPTASLATCLDFAARVLSSTASVQEICTKSVLAPMVVEAHRYGQQVTKHLEPGAPPDVRKLLKVLQSNNLDRASPLAKLDVADLTWDFEGIVADTLEMELEELKDRAAMNTTDTCVVFSAWTPVSTGGQAVIWFPLKNHGDLRNEDDRRSAMKKQQILLYVCPGRVKVVKSVGDLVKKLHDELPCIRGNDALYSVWAVFKNDIRIDNQEERQAPSTVMKDGMVSQFAVDQGLSSPAEFMASVSANLETDKPHNSAIPPAGSKQTRCDESDRNRRSMAESTSNHAVDSVSEDAPEAASQPQHDAQFDQEKLPPLSPRFTVYKGASWYAPGSIFSFGMDNKFSTDLELTSNEHLPDDLEVDKKGVENVDGNDMKGEENAASCTDDNQIQAPWKRRHVISSSVPNFSAERYLDYDVGMNLGVRLQQELAWQSCDGKVLRSSVRSQLVMPATDKGSEEYDELSDVNNQHDNEDNVRDYEAAENEATVSIDEVTEVEEISLLESSEQFPDSLLLEQTGSLEDGGTSIFRFGYDPHKENDRQPNGEWLSPAMTASTEMPTDTKSADHFDASGVDQGDMSQITSSSNETDDVIPVEPNDDKVEPSDLPIETEEIASPPKPKSAPVNYKDKLGVRVWWELEYTARKLEREEMMERRQQARHHQVGNRTITSSGASRQKFAHHSDPQRTEPTGWSKRFRPEKQNEVSASIDGAATDGSKQPNSVAIVPELIEEVHDINDITAMTTQATRSHSPFTVRGRVPIRIHRDPSKVVVPAEAEAQKIVSNESVSASSPLRGRKTLPNEDPSHIKPSELPQSTADVHTTPRVPTPTPVATFIPLGEDPPRSPRAPTESRQQRLNELRQKKLRKLQQTRDLSLQQHKEKQHQRQIQRPLSFASSVYSKKASNRQLIQNALEFTLLAGGSMEKERAQALQALADSTCDNFIVLLKSAKELKFRALYENHVERDSATRIYSVLPNNSSRAPLKLGGSEVISQFFKYSSAKKQFLPVSTRSFTVKTDACALVEQLVFKGKSKSSRLL
ncbi:hypothetical protein PR003_g6944 [Phytophthora rubi]|uniref:CKK domain-containing protein n=1 Tax=Phytophthora rubi TaxID=129364 RepID=A0A6A4FNC9_9STRA|nr:hypothetical protein PR003_g6944 [Phytophthora rubi]